MRIPFIPLYLGLSTFICFQMAMADEIAQTASVQNVSFEKPSSTTSDISDAVGSKSPRCMINPRGEGCNEIPTSDQLSTAVDIMIASGQLGNLVSPIADMNAALAMQQEYTHLT